MFGIALVLTACVAAFNTTFSLFAPRLSFLECFFMAPAIGLTSSAFLALFVKSLPFASSGVGLDVVLGCLALQVGLAFWFAQSTTKKLKQFSLEIKRELREHRVAVIVLSVMSVWWVHMNSIHYLFRRGSEHVAGGSVYADLPFHTNLATSFVYGCNKDATVTSNLLSPFYAGETLAYPFIPDFYLGVLMGAGCTLRESLVVTGSVLLSAMFGLLYLFNFHVTGSQRCGLLSVFLTLLAGGIGGFYYMQRNPNWWRWSELNSHDFKHGPDHVLYWVDRKSAFWFSLPAHILFPQRTVQHAYPLTISVLLVIWKGVVARASGASVAADSKQKTDDGKAKPTHASFQAAVHTPGQLLQLFAFAGFLTALIPLSQPHSFVSVGVVILIAAILQTLGALVRFVGFRELLQIVLRWAAFGVVAFALGLPQFFKHFFHRVSFGTGAQKDAFIRWSSAWHEEGKGEDAVVMWWRALGLFVPLFALSPLFLRSWTQFSFYVGFALLFVVCNLIMFQPWHLDNTKLLYVWVFGASGFVAQLLHRVMSFFEGIAQRYPPTSAAVVAPSPSTTQKAGKAGKASKHEEVVQPSGNAARRVVTLLGCAMAWMVFASLVFSGSLACYREMLNNAKVYDDVDLDLASWLVHNTPPDAVFLTDPLQDNHIRAESSLAGRQIALGFVGWLSSHGIGYQSRRQDLIRAIQGNEQTVAAFVRHNISYVVVDGMSSHKFNLDLLNDIADLRATNGKYSVFELRKEVFANPSPRKCRGGSPTNKTACLEADCWWFPTAKMACQQKPVPPHRVEDCGKATAEECRNEGCVWVQGYPGPWCHKPRWMVAGTPPVTIPMQFPPSSGSDCGWPSMQEHQCAKRGCIWRPAGPYEPWCVFP